MIAARVWKVAGAFEEPEIKFGGDGKTLEATVETNNTKLVMRQNEENIAEKAVLESQKYIFREGTEAHVLSKHTPLPSARIRAGRLRSSALLDSIMRYLLNQADSMLYLAAAVQVI